MKSCDVAGRMVENLEGALQHEDLSPWVAREIADEVSTRNVSVEDHGPEVDVDAE